MSQSEVVRQCQDSIARGSKTFTFASRFFARDKMEDAALLYSWCRHCDDAIDTAQGADKAIALEQLRALTQTAIGGSDDGPLPFQALAHILAKHKIPEHYPLELIEGMAMDAAFQPPADRSELRLYCYRVAGVVGLMMAHIMGVNDERALQNACDLGIAMQLTNIARDVLTDFEIGRCYLPADLLQRHGLQLSNYAEASHRASLAAAVQELLGEADELYQSGQAGTIHLDRTSALVILIARFTYARIGNKVRAAGPRAWDQRQITTGTEKFFCLLRALGVWLSQSLQRLFSFRPWKPVYIKQIWRPQ